MELDEAILTRRTVHKYRPAPVPPEVLERVLTAAHHAPNHKLTWPWRLTVVGPETRARIIEVGVAVKSRGRTLTEAQRRAIETKLGNPGALVVVTQQRCDDGFRAREDYAAVSCAIQNMLLTAHGAGYGAKWGTGGVTREPATYEALGIDPDAEEIVGFVWVGVPAEVPAIKRPALADVVRRLP